MKKVISVLGFLFSLAACDTVVEVDIPLEKQKLVVNAIATTDSVWSAQVTQSRYILDDAPKLAPTQGKISVLDAATRAYVDELVFVANKKRWIGTTHPELGRTYLLQVQMPNYETIESTTIIPQAVPIEKVEVDETGQQGNSGEMNNIMVYFNDPASERNFYLLTVGVKGYYLVNGDTVWYENPVYFERVDASIDNQFNSGGITLNDATFNGRSNKVTLRVADYYFAPQNPAELTVTLSSITEAYYNYLVSVNLQMATDGDPFAQPVLIYSNIKNGLGILGAYSRSDWNLK